MANPYNSEVGQQEKTGGSGYRDKRGKKASPALRYRSPAWPGVPGKVRAVAGPKLGKKKQPEPVSEGL